MQRYGRTDEQTDGRYQAHYLPASLSTNTLILPTIIFQTVYSPSCCANLFDIRDKIIVTTGTTLAARIRLYGEFVHGLLYDKQVALSVPVW